MRRLIPLVLVGVLVLATIGAALIGGSESVGTEGNPVAQEALSKAVKKTLAAESLTMSLGQGFTVVHEAPDLTETTMPFAGVVIQDGPHSLTKAFGQWFEDLPSASLPEPYAAFYSPSQTLERLLDLPSLEFTGAQTFVSERVLAPTRTDHSTQTIIETVRTAHGFVVSVRTAIRGAPPIPIPVLTCRNCRGGAIGTSTAGSGAVTAVTFSGFNSSHVSIPSSDGILTRSTVATRKIGHDHLAVYEWLSGGSPGATTGFSLTSESGRQIDGGSGGPTGAPISERDGLLPNSGGSSGPGSLGDVTVSVSGSDVTNVRLVVGGRTVDAMVPVKVGSSRFVVLVGKVPRGRETSIQGLNSSNHVVTSTPYTW
jgi:hypothetical protein